MLALLLSGVGQQVRCSPVDGEECATRATVSTSLQQPLDSDGTLA